MQYTKQDGPIAIYEPDVEELGPGDVLMFVHVDHGVLTVKGRARRPLEDAARLVVAFLGGAAVSLGLSLILRAL